MSNVIPFPELDRPKDYGLGCPICRRAWWIHIQKNSWVVCHQHQLQQFVGRGLLGIPRDENDDNLKRNRTILDSYCEDSFHLPNAGGDHD